MKNKFDAVLIFLLIISTSLFDCENYLFIRIFSLSILSILVLYLIKNGKDGDNPVNMWFLILFVLSFTFSYSFSVNKYNVRMFYAEYSGYFALLFIIAKMKNNEKLAEILPYAIIASSLIQTGYSFPQILKGIQRINGNAGYANFMGFHLSLGILSAIHLLKKAVASKNVIKISVYALISIVLTFTALRTGSRNIVILGPAILVYAFWEMKKRYKLVILSVIVILAFIIPNLPVKRLLNEAKSNPYGVQRLNIYKQAITIAIKNPIIGVGRNNLALYTPETNFPVEGGIGRYGVHAEIAHNEYIEWIVGSGLFGLLMLFLIAIIFIRFLSRSLFEQNNKRYLIFLFLLYVFYSIIDNSLYLPYNAAVFFVILGIMAPEDSYNLPVKTVNKLILTMFLLISIVFVFLDVSVYFYSKRMIAEQKMLNGNIENDVKAYQEMLRTSYICSALSNDPKYFRYSFQISEKLYEKTGFVSDFYGALNGLELFQKNDRRNQNAYLDGARLIRKYKDTLLRKNTNLNEKIMGFYEKAISLSPYNPFYRSEYAEYLVSVCDTNNACLQMETAIKNEYNFIKGYLFLYKYQRNANKEELVSNIERIEKISRHSGKLRDYDKTLISK